MYSHVSLAFAAWVIHAYQHVPARRLFHLDPVLLRTILWGLMAFGAGLAAAAILRFGGAGFLGLEREQ